MNGERKGLSLEEIKALDGRALEEAIMRLEIQGRREAEAALDRIFELNAQAEDRRCEEAGETSEDGLGDYWRGKIGNRDVQLGYAAGLSGRYLKDAEDLEQMGKEEDRDYSHDIEIAKAKAEGFRQLFGWLCSEE